MMDLSFCQKERCERKLERIRVIRGPFVKWSLPVGSF